MQVQDVLIDGLTHTLSYEYEHTKDTETYIKIMGGKRTIKCHGFILLFGYMLPVSISSVCQGKDAPILRGTNA